jgi:hypothetical protein
MQEHVGKKLEQVEVAGHEKVQAAHVRQIDATKLEHPCSHKRQKVDNEQILGNGRYVAKHLCLLQLEGLITMIPFSRICAQNYEKYLFFSAKWALKQLFFIKKAIFSVFLLFF